MGRDIDTVVDSRARFVRRRGFQTGRCATSRARPVVPARTAGTHRRPRARTHHARRTRATHGVENGARCVARAEPRARARQRSAARDRHQHQCARAGAASHQACFDACNTRRCRAGHRVGGDRGVCTARLPVLRRTRRCPSPRPRQGCLDDGLLRQVRRGAPGTLDPWLDPVDHFVAGSGLPCTSTGIGASRGGMQRRAMSMAPSA